MRNFPLWALVAVAGSAFADTSRLMSFEELCKVDNLCAQLKDRRGNLIGISPAFRKLMEDGRDVFIDTALKYQVDPRAPIAAIAAENTMNVQASDEVQKWLAYRGITSVGGRQFSFGLGQINMPAALEAEAHLAKIDGRPPRSSSEVRQQLLTLEGAAYYATGIVRKAQDDYKAKGIDISSRPEILATLYNLGGTATRAAAAAASGKEPQVNYFGYFVAHNLKDVEGLIGWDPVKKKRTKPRVSEDLMSGDRTFLAQRAVPVHSSPSSCSMDGRADAGAFARVMTRRDFPKVADMAGPFKVIGRGVDCDMRDFVQVQFLNGMRGWMPVSALNDEGNKIHRTSQPLSLKCSEADAKKCLEKVKAAFGEDIINRDDLAYDRNSQLSVALPTLDGKPLKASFKKPDVNECNHYSSGSRGFRGGRQQMYSNAKELEEFEKKINEIQEDIIKRYGLSGWNDPDNPVKWRPLNLDQCKRDGMQCHIRIDDAGNPSMVRLMTVPEFNAYDPSKHDLRDVILFARSKRIEIFANNPLQQHQPPPLEAFLAESKTAIEHVREQCKDLLAESGMDKHLDNLQRTVEKIDDNAYRNFFGPGSVRQILEAMHGKCRGVRTFLKDGPVDPWMDRESVDVMVNGHVQNLPVKVAKKLDVGRKAVMEGLGGAVENIDKSYASVLQMAGAGSDKCQYDPFKALSLVQKMAGEPCVEQIIVPDRFILAGVTGEFKNKVVYGEADEKNFQVQLGGCRGGSSGSLREYIRGVQ